MAETVKKTKAPAKPAADKKNAPKPKAVAEKPESGPVAVRAKTRATSAKANGVNGKVTSTVSAKPRRTATKEVAAEPATEAAIHALPSREQVAQLAHRYWIERGRHHGSHEQDWLRAEQELRGKAS
jgi:hypothetical protein